MSKEKIFTQEMFNDWVDKQIFCFWHSPQMKGVHLDEVLSMSHFPMTTKILDDIVIARRNFDETIIMSLATGKRGAAKCHKDDKYDLRVGLAIAWARFKGETVPKVYEMIAIDPDELKHGQKFFITEDENGKTVSKEYIYVGMHPKYQNCAGIYNIIGISSSGGEPKWIITTAVEILKKS